METTIQGTKWFHHSEKISSNAIQFEKTSKDLKISGSTCSKNMHNSLQSK